MHREVQNERSHINDYIHLLSEFAHLMRASITSHGVYEIDDIKLREVFRLAMSAESDFEKSLTAFCHKNGFKHELRNHKMYHRFA